MCLAGPACSRISVTSKGNRKSQDRIAAGALWSDLTCWGHDGEPSDVAKGIEGPHGTWGTPRRASLKSDFATPAAGRRASKRAISQTAQQAPTTRAAATAALINGGETSLRANMSLPLLGSGSDCVPADQDDVSTLLNRIALSAMKQVQDSCICRAGLRHATRCRSLFLSQQEIPIGTG